MTNGKRDTKMDKEREREVVGSTHWDKRKRGKAEKKMTQHGWLASRFQLPQ